MVVSKQTNNVNYVDTEIKTMMISRNNAAFFAADELATEYVRAPVFARTSAPFAAASNIDVVDI